MKNLLKMTLITILAVFTFSCSDDDDSNPPPVGTTIADFVAANPDFSSLGAALERAGLDTVLSNSGTFTVFAPNNAAFAEFLSSNGFASLNDVPVDVLTNTLLNHVLATVNTSDNLETGYVNSLATFADTEANLSLYIDTSAGVRINGISNVTQADVPASNGVIHAVDTVIAIPTIVTQATANTATFSVLVDALIAASDNSVDYVALLSGTGNSPFTVFAPTNTAFANLLTALGLTSLDEVPTALLQTILNYHVIAGANVRAEALTEGQTATTFQGEDITISLEGGPKIIDATGMASNIIVTNVQTGNGVVHAIDKVLLPQAALDIVNPTISGLASMTPSLSILTQALNITGLNDVLNNRDASFTVFAPTDTAFQNFLTENSIPGLGDIPVPVLTQVLLNHVLTGEFLSSSFTTSYTTTLATFSDTNANLSLYINTSNGVRLNGVSQVEGPDVTAANGVVHIVDGVIALPTVVTFATADPTFSSLVAALTRDDQPDYVTVLSTLLGTDPAPFTVFAPTNAAFDDLLVELGAGGLGDIDGAILTAALNTHVIPGANVRADQLVSGPVPTLGEPVIIDAANSTVTDPNGRVSNIIVVNVQAANGVVHAIDKVLLPTL